jgi:hypothetical protein
VIVRNVYGLNAQIRLHQLFECTAQLCISTENQKTGHLRYGTLAQDDLKGRWWLKARLMAQPCWRRRELPWEKRLRALRLSHIRRLKSSGQNPVVRVAMGFPPPHKAQPAKIQERRDAKSTAIR